MYTGIVFTKDGKLFSQLDSWCRQQLPGHLRLEQHATLDSYREMLQAESGRAAAGSAPEANKDAEPAAETPNKTIRIYIVDGEFMDKKPDAWIAGLHKLTNESGFRLIGVRPTVLMMGYETGALRPEVMQIEAVDDLILKPVDKAVFLQKVEFLTADAGGNVTPSFLFRAKTEQIIEAGRDVVVDEISEFAVAVRSPGPVPEGAFASIHSDVFGTKGERRLIGRVYESVRHPIREGEFLVRFSYFGVSTDQLNTIRRYIRNNQTQVRAKGLGMAGAAAASLSGAKGGLSSLANKLAKPALSKQLQERMSMINAKKLAIIDVNLDSLTELKSILESSFTNVKVSAFPSYARLAGELQKMLKPQTALSPEMVSKAPTHAQGSAPAPAAAGPALPGGNRITVVLRGKSHDFVRFEPELKKTEIVLGKTVAEWQERPDQFKNAVEKDDREAFDEFLTFLDAGARPQAVLRMKGLGERSAFFSVSGSLDRASGGEGHLLQLNLQEIDSDQWAKSILASGVSAVSATDLAEFRFDSILIDGTFLRPDPLTWYKQLVDLLRATKVIGQADMGPKIFVLSDPKAGAKLDSFRFKEVFDFTYRPIDRRFMILKYMAFTQGLTLARELDAPPFVPCELNAKLGKEVTMDELAEYGLSIVHPTAFKDKSFMRFFSTLFGEDGEWVSGKCHSCVKKQDVEVYRCQFMFFGPNDELLRRIRSWIREDYVAKKDTKG